jgi:hypothetical protein
MRMTLVVVVVVIYLFVQSQVRTSQGQWLLIAGFLWNIPLLSLYTYSIYSLTCQCPTMKFHGMTCKDSAEKVNTS